MKRTAKTWLYFALQIVFMLVLPCVLVWVQYGETTTATGYKLQATAIVLFILIFVIFKKIFINKWLKTIDGKIVNIETNALTITDETAIQANKKAWRFYSLMQLLSSIVIPLLVMILAIITIKAVEQDLIELYGCLMFCLLSIIVGCLFRVAEIYSMKLTHEKDEEETSTGTATTATAKK